MFIRVLVMVSTVLSVLMVAPTARADIYRYVLEDGTVMYTTEPQGGRRATEVIGDAQPDRRRDRVIPEPPERPNPNPDRSPDAFDAIIREAADAYDIPFEFVKAVIRVESAFDPHAVSHAGAQGLMQLMPGTAESLNCEDPFEPRANIMAGTQFLRILSNRYNGDINLVLAAYNAGSGTVSRYDGIPYEATRRYIERVYQYYLEYLEGLGVGLAMTDRRSTIREDIWNLPNVLTMGRIAVIPLVCWLAMIDKPVAAIAAVVLFGLAAFTDWLDGYIARRRNLVSMTGKFLDPLADKLLVMAVLVTLLPVGRLPAWFVIIMLAREMSVTGLRALAAGEGIMIDAGWGGKWKVGFQFVGLSCLLIHYPYAIDYGLFTLDVRFHEVGFALMIVSLAYSIGSGWEYFRGFVHGVADVKLSGAGI